MSGCQVDSERTEDGGGEFGLVSSGCHRKDDKLTLKNGDASLTSAFKGEKGTWVGGGGWRLVWWMVVVDI